MERSNICRVCKREHGMAMQHTPLEYLQADNDSLKAQLGKTNLENAYANNETRNTLIGGIQKRDVKISALQQQVEALQQQVEALQRERDEAIEAASLPTWVCDGCGRVSSEGWINRVIDSFEGTDYEMECPTCGVRAIEEDCASDLVRERDDLQAALDAEREKVTVRENDARLYLGQLHRAQTQLSALQGLARVSFPEPDPHKWTAAYQAVKRIGRTLPATTPAPRQRQVHSCEIPGCVSCANPEEGGDGE